MDSFQVIINLKKETSYKSVEEETFVTFYFIYETSDTIRYNTVIIMTPYLGCFVFQHDSEVLNQPRHTVLYIAPFYQDISCITQNYKHNRNQLTSRGNL